MFPRFSYMTVFYQDKDNKAINNNNESFQVVADDKLS